MEDDNPASREAKGKGKVQLHTEESDEGAQGVSGPNQERRNESLASRIVNSASALSNSLISGSSSAADIASLVDISKNPPSGAQHTTARAGESSAQFRARIPPSCQSFRSDHAQEHSARAEAAFAEFLDSTSVFVPSPNTSMETAWQASVPSESSIPSSGYSRAFSSVDEQENQDGAEVAALLSLDDEEPPARAVDDSILPEDLVSLREALFGEEAYSSIGSTSLQWDHILNFIPEYLRVDGDSRHGTRSPGAPAKSQELLAHMGTTDAVEGSKIWLDQWTRVLTQYQDEVWGDLGSLVVEACTEVQKLEEAGRDHAPIEPKALLRLRAILGHLRRP